MASVIVDPHRCEGEKKCVQVCPMGVFAMRPPEPGLSVLQRVKVFVHGGKQAKVEHAELCAACGRCEEACPEKAIKVIVDPS